MGRLIALAAGLVALTAGSAAHAQTVYPIDRADILAGSRFDFKVEFAGLVDPAKIAVTLNGEDYAKVFGKAADLRRARGRQGSVGADPARCFACAAGHLTRSA